MLDTSIRPDRPPLAPPIVKRRTQKSKAGRHGPPPLGDYLLRQASAELKAVADQEREPRRKRSETVFLLFRAVPGAMLSALIHLILLIALGLTMMIGSDLGARIISLNVVETELEEFDEPELIDMPMELKALPEPDLGGMSLEDSPLDGDLDAAIDSEPKLDERLLDQAIQETIREADLASAEFGAEAVTMGMTARGKLRSQALSLGATSESEHAVDLALEWLVRHQRADGSWSFNHREGPHHCPNCRCGNPGGNSDSYNGATAMALLPLLGAGNTHQNGPYREAVAKGIRYLIEHQRSDGGFNEAGGRMYSHGLATLALCEDLSMTRYLHGKPQPQPRGFDPRRVLRTPTEIEAAAVEIHDLAVAAQRAVLFIESAQHAGGGWRYMPKQAGDTSVVGWQVMALKSGTLAGLAVKRSTLAKVDKFLDSVAGDRIGSCYGYTSAGGSGRAGATTSIGLLCRMFNGWGRDERGLSVGVRRIAEQARPKQGLYFYYYATQVMHHVGGPSWRQWNDWMRDHLVRAQSHQGSERGSWQLNGSHDNAGRLYCTSLATMTLEVYYRYSPIYGRDALAPTEALLK